MTERTIKDMGVYDDGLGRSKGSYGEIYLGGDLSIDNPKRKCTVALYRQHKNGFFYLKRIGRITDVSVHDSLFDHDLIRVQLSSRTVVTNKKIHIMLYPYRYKKSLIDQIPDQTNPYNLPKGKNSKREHKFEYKIEPLFEISLDKVK